MHFKPKNKKMFYPDLYLKNYCIPKFLCRKVKFFVFFPDFRNAIVIMLNKYTNLGLKFDFMLNLHVKQRKN